MPSGGVERKLAAILAADVAGYSRLIGLDEEGTLARLKARRHELIDPKIAEHRGRIVVTIRTPVILAGGLGPGNVAAGIAAVRPAVSIPKRVPTATMAVIVKTSISCTSSCASPSLWAF